MARVARCGCPSPRVSRFSVIGFVVLLLALCGSRARAEQPASAKTPAPLQAALERGHESLAAGDYSKAKAAFDTAFLLGDESAAVFGGRGAARIGMGEIDGGIADLEEAIRRNPGDLGQKYSPNAAVVLSKAALQHGEEQVRKMLKDRPAMAKNIELGDALWRWAARKFAGEDLEDTIDWDPTPPREASADHSVPWEERRGSIRVSKYAAFDEQ